MKYQIWDLVNYDSNEKLVPFTKVYESESLNDIRNHIELLPENSTHCLIVDGIIITDLSKFIYEQNGMSVTKRKILSDKKILL
jgi:hypothetical protein